MNTKIVEEYYLSKKEILVQIKEYEKIIQNIFEEIKVLIENKKYIAMINKNVYYCMELVSLIPKFSEFNILSLSSTILEKDINELLTKHFDNNFEWEIMEWEEKIKLIDNGHFPCKVKETKKIFYKNTHGDGNSLIKKDNLIKYCNLESSNLSIGNGTPLGICRFNGVNSNTVTEEKVLEIWIKNKLIPKGLNNENIYKKIMESPLSKILNFKLEKNKIKLEYKEEELCNFLNSTEDLKNKLLNEDYERAGIIEYPPRILNDINEGHWSLWPKKNEEEYFKINLKEKLVAKNPKSSIIDGIIGIDFGTKSTVVVYQKNNIHTLPMRIGTGDLSKKVEKQHYENPTILEFQDLEKFMERYIEKKGRPNTKWEDIKVSHIAFDRLKNSTNSQDYGAYLNELKQWAGDKEKRLKIIDKIGNIKDINSYLELNEDEIDPIEIYAYYLGLYINNMHNGIYLDYYLSFPVTYEIEVRNKIINSFYKGLKKSLPESLHEDKEVMEQFKVNMGASEPAAYAITALTEYEFEPEDEENIFYGIFDFGGGTTDFDFGIWREANGLKERRYDYVIEHFGAGGDKYLGGENLLELLAFEVFKNNIEESDLRKNDIPFTLPYECKEFIGSEMLLLKSREANLNTKNLMEVLRGFWENGETFDKGLKVNLYNIKGELKVSYPLKINIENLRIILRNRINKGIINFFESLRLAFSNEKINKINKIHIFLAGNSSKSPLVSELFEEAIEKEITSSKNQSIKKEFFEIFPPLGTAASLDKMHERGIEKDINNLELPTGKTGVAFGLIESRKGGNILVIDENINNKNIKFKYYLGESRKKQFKVIFERETEYHKWIPFIDAIEDKFELYYTDQPSASTDQMKITDESIRLKRINIDITNEEAIVYIRAVSPTVIEYVVAKEEDISSEKYLNIINQIQLN